MDVNSETPVSTRFATPKYVLAIAHGAAHPEPVCFKPAEGREVDLVEAGLNQPGIGVAAGAVAWAVGSVVAG